MQHEMKGEEAMEIFNIIKQHNLLPATLDGLVPISFAGQKALRFYRDIVKDMEELGMTQEQQKVTLRDGQDLGEMLLDIEAKIGELLPSAEDNRKAGGKRGRAAQLGERLERVLPDGITMHKAHQARAIKNNPEIVAKIKAQARANEDIATKTAVLNAIGYEKEKQRKALVTITKEPIAAEQAKYLLGLDQAILAIPRKPPTHWNERALNEAMSKAKIIRDRLEVFNG
jgi:hypothetical protein